MKGSGKEFGLLAANKIDVDIKNNWRVSMLRRLASLVSASLIVTVALSQGMGFCATKAKSANGKTPNKTAPGKTTTQIKWVTKTFGKLSFSIPSNWKMSNQMPENLAGWYIGANTTKVNAGFSCGWEETNSEQMLKDFTTYSVKKNGSVTVAGISATEYFGECNGDTGLVIIADQPDADGKRLIIEVGSETGEWKKYEPILRKIIASIKVNNETATHNNK